MSYDYNYNPNYDFGAASAGFALFGGATNIYLIFMLALSIFLIVCQWKLFEKAGEAGWKCIIPIYNSIILLKIAGLSGWYLLLCFVPFVNLYVIFKQFIELAKKFGKNAGFGVLMVFLAPICLPILAFGKAQYNSGVSSEVYSQKSTTVDQNLGAVNYDANTVSFQNPAVNIQNTNPNKETFTSPVQPVQEPHNNLQPEAKVYSPDNLDRTVYIKKFCPNCGNNLEPGQQFCGKCGNKL